MRTIFLRTIIMSSALILISITSVDVSWGRRSGGEEGRHIPRQETPKRQSVTHPMTHTQSHPHAQQNGHKTQNNHHQSSQNHGYWHGNQIGQYGYQKYYYNHQWYYAKTVGGYYVVPVVCQSRFIGYGYYVPAGYLAPAHWVTVGCGYWAPQSGIWLP